MDKFRGMMDDAKAAIQRNVGSDTEKKIAEALSNQNWGASSTLLNEIAQITFDYQEFPVVVNKIWGALDMTGRNWRTVFKALTLLEHLVKNGSDRIVEEARDHMHKLRRLSDFNFYEGHVDKGAGVHAWLMADSACNRPSTPRKNRWARTQKNKAAGPAVLTDQNN